MEFAHEGLPPHPKDEVLLNRIDSVLAEESLILDGLKKAVTAGHITETEQQQWLSEYVDKRNRGVIYVPETDRPSF